jgi:transcriptional regulator with XRE-family HTH domain
MKRFAAFVEPASNMDYALYRGDSMLYERLIDLRVKSGLTQADIAKILKITRQAYCSYELNKREMDFASLVIIANFFNVTTDYLLGRGEVDSVNFGADEINIISKYRLLDGRGKDAIKVNLEFELTHVIKSNKKHF